jgi:pyruvate dehydrogenase E1 component alpha subunit
MAGELRERPAAFGIPVIEVDGQDIRSVYLAAQELVNRARGGEGPGFLVCDTYRYYGHHVGDINRGYYRSKDEEEHWWKERDPLKLMSTWLSDQLAVPATIFEEIERKVGDEIAHGVEFALNTSYPDASEVYDDVYA